MDFVSKKHIRWLLDLLTIFTLVFTLVTYFLPHEYAFDLSLSFEEDHFFEWLSVVVLAVAGLNCLLRQPKSLYWSILGALLLFIAMEEISWFQRVLHLPSPNFFLKWNDQQELNLHGLAVDNLFFEQLIIIGAGLLMFPLFHQTKIRFSPVAQLSHLKLAVLIVLVLIMNFLNEESQYEPYRENVLEEGIEMVIYLQLFLASLKIRK